MSDRPHIVIRSEFKKLISPLTTAERDQLVANLQSEGCRDALVVWRDPKTGDLVLLDGHHRYAICERHKLEFKTTEIQLPDEDAATMWVIENQLGRRNLSNYQKALLALAYEPLEAKKALERKREGKHVPNSAHAGQKTRDVIAAKVGLGHDTIAKAKEIRDKAPADLINKLIADEISINRAHQELMERLQRPTREHTTPPPRRKKHTPAQRWRNFIHSLNGMTEAMDVLPPDKKKQARRELQRVYAATIKLSKKKGDKPLFARVVRHRKGGAE